MLISPADIMPMALSNIGMELIAEEKILTKMLQKLFDLCKFKLFYNPMPPSALMEDEVKKFQKENDFHSN